MSQRRLAEAAGDRPHDGRRGSIGPAGAPPRPSTAVAARPSGARTPSTPTARGKRLLARGPEQAIANAEQAFMAPLPRLTRSASSGRCAR